MSDLGVVGVEGAGTAIARAFDAERRSDDGFGRIQRMNQLLGMVMHLVREQTTRMLGARGSDQAKAVASLRRLEGLASSIAACIRVTSVLT